MFVSMIEILALMILAESNGLIIAQWIFNALLAIGLAYVGHKSRQVDGLEKSLHELTAKLVDERMRAMTHELKNHVESFKLTLGLLKKDIEDADGTIGSLNERDQKIELAVASKVDQLKEYIRDNAASKKDLERHEQTVGQKFERMGERLGTLAEKVAVLSDRGDRK